MRNLVEVIDQIIKVIPSSEEGFIETLKSNRSSALYTSPETLRLRWEVTADTLSRYIGEHAPLNEWQQKVVNIWMDEK